MKAIVLAGGVGERFWPESTAERPKQFLDLHGGGSLILRTVQRLMRRLLPEDIFVITASEHRELTISELPMLDPENIIGEPLRRNTAPACALGARIAGTDQVQLVVPADHLISDEEGFWRTVDIAFEEVMERGGLITFGVTPTSPHTGYGYIHARGPSDMSACEVLDFKEKPDLETARGFLGSGDHYWNSGIFVWRGSEFLEEIGRTEPSIHEAICSLKDLSSGEMERAYSAMPTISVDHAVMERSRAVKMVKASFLWEDLGSWTSVLELEDEATTTEDRFIDGAGIFVRSRTGRRIAVVGLDDVLIVDSPNGLLVCSRDSAQDVRLAAAHFRERRGP